VTTFVLIPGAGGVGWYWHLVAERLSDAGHEAIAVDLPGDDDSTALPEYAQLVLDAIGERDDAVLVAQSLGAFTAPLVAERAPVAELVFVNAMIPRSGERPGEWWGNTRSEQARRAAAERGGYSPDFDLETYFLHDVPPEVAAAGAPYQREEADAVFGSVCGFEAWPAIPIRAVAGVADRFFPVDFQRELAHARLGIEADVLPGGHLIALSQREALASYLLTR
jgi:pimeloyl-ACP methyl ester carboxylesterase